MLINVKSVKSIIKDSGLRSNPATIEAINRYVNTKLTSLCQRMKEEKKKTITDYDVNTRMA